MIKLYQFEPAWGLPNASPFCLKIETYLRMVNLPYESVYTAEIGKAPKGKMPYIEDRGKVIADSNFIIAYLKSTYGDPLDSNLSRSELAVSLAMRRLIEENLYWTAVHGRWMDESNWPKTKAIFFDSFPPILKNLIPILARQQIQKSLNGHGMGRHQEAEIYEIGVADVVALSDFLGDKLFFMGDQPTSLDASAYGTLANILWVPIESPIKEQASKLTNLSDFCQRMKERFYAG